MLIVFILWYFLIVSKKFKKFPKNNLLFCRNIVEYTCKSNEGTPSERFTQNSSSFSPLSYIVQRPVRVSVPVFEFIAFQALSGDFSPDFCIFTGIRRFYFCYAAEPADAPGGRLFKREIRLRGRKSLLVFCLCKNFLNFLQEISGNVLWIFLQNRVRKGENSIIASKTAHY